VATVLAGLLALAAPALLARASVGVSYGRHLHDLGADLWG
jgi:hypothetical protein